MNKKTITAIIPVKNEEGCIEATIREIPRDVVDEILVVDGASTDETVARARAAGARVIPQEGTGYGAAVETGVKHASGDLITLLDGDGAYDASSVRDLLRRLEEGYDVVFSSRYLPGSGSEDDTPVTWFGNKLFTFLLNVLRGVKITDALFLYILAKKEVFQKIRMRSRHFEYCMEFPIRVHQARFRYAEIPSREKKRLAGRSKVNVWADGLRILGVLLRG